MARVTVKMNSTGARALMNRADVQEMLLDRAQRIADGAGAGFEADVQPGPERAHGMVKSTDYQSMLAQAKSNALLKAIGAGR